MNSIKMMNNTKITDLLDEQQRTIEALNSCIGGKGSTTTENIILVDRQQSIITVLSEALQSIADLEQSDLPAAECLDDAINRAQNALCAAKALS